MRSAVVANLTVLVFSAVRQLHVTVDNVWRRGARIGPPHFVYSSNSSAKKTNAIGTGTRRPLPCVSRDSRDKTRDPLFTNDNYLSNACGVCERLKGESTCVVRPDARRSESR